MYRKHQRRNRAGGTGAALLAFLAGGHAWAVDDLTRPIKASPDGHFLAKPDGSPFYYMAEDVEALFWAISKEDADYYLRKRAEQGFTVIMGQVAPKDDIEKPNFYGDRVFINRNPAQPNPKYFAHVDWVVARARNYGLRIALAPVTGITHLTAQHIYSVDNVEQYGRWLGERYRGQGIIWNIGFDSMPIWADGDWGDPATVVLKDFRPVYDLLTKGIAQGQGERPFFTFHPACCNFAGTAEPRTSLYLGDREWLSMNLLQSSHFDESALKAFLKESGLAFGWNSTFNYEPIRREYDSRPVRPVVDAEPQYDMAPYGLDQKYSSHVWDETDIRNSAYHSVFAGAAGHDYNNTYVVGFNDPAKKVQDIITPMHPIHWKKQLDAPGAWQVGYVKKLMLSRPYFSRIPDQGIIIGDAGEGRAHISGTRDKTGSYLMVYLPQGQSVTVDMTQLSGKTAHGWWYDPRTGKATKIEATFATNHHERFTPPSSGRGNDWVLVLDDASKEYAAPGAHGTY